MWRWSACENILIFCLSWNFNCSKMPTNCWSFSELSVIPTQKPQKPLTWSPPSRSQSWSTNLFRIIRFEIVRFRHLFNFYGSLDNPKLLVISFNPNVFSVYISNSLLRICSNEPRMWSFTFVEEDSAEKTFVLILGSMFKESQVFTRCCYYWVNPRLKQYISMARLSLHHANGNQKTYTDERVLEEENVPFRCLPDCVGFILVLNCSESVYFWSYSISKRGSLVIYQPLVLYPKFFEQKHPISTT